jgi:hypothetical protein
MTEKEVIVEFATRMGYEGSAAEIDRTARKAIDTYTSLVVDTAMANGKCSFGKVGTFKCNDVKAVPARTGVKNSLTGGIADHAAKPARKKLAFSLSKSGKLIGA